MLEHNSWPPTLKIVGSNLYTAKTVKIHWNQAIELRRCKVLFKDVMFAFTEQEIIEDREIICTIRSTPYVLLPCAC